MPKAHYTHAEAQKLVGRINNKLVRLIQNAPTSYAMVSLVQTAVAAFRQLQDATGKPLEDRVFYDIVDDAMGGRVKHATEDTAPAEAAPAE